MVILEIKLDSETREIYTVAHTKNPELLIAMRKAMALLSQIDFDPAFALKLIYKGPI